MGNVSSQYLAGDLSFEDLLERRKDTITVDAQRLSAPVLIVDDIHGSGGTIREITRRLRAIGAEQVFALTVTKTLRHHREV